VTFYLLILSFCGYGSRVDVSEGGCDSGPVFYEGERYEDVTRFLRNPGVQGSEDEQEYTDYEPGKDGLEYTCFTFRDRTFQFAGPHDKEHGEDDCSVHTERTAPNGVLSWV
jgi:hypothetical protein